MSESRVRWAFVLVAVGLGCAPADDGPAPGPPTDAGGSATTLRGLAEARGFLVGTVVRAAPLASDATYAEVLAREFNVITPETEMNLRFIHPERNRYDFTRPDAIVAFAETNRMRVFGHTLVWGVNPPAWLTERAGSRDDLIAILRDHITTVVGRYRGRVFAWNVVNESVANPTGPGLPGLQQSVWLGIGPDYIDLAFRFAREADPQALLFLNDYAGEGLSQKSEAIYQLAQRLVRSGVPLDGVGLQMHLDESGAARPAGVVTAADLTTNIRRLTDLGLQVHITEMDVQLAIPQGSASAAQLTQQARVYREIIAPCLENPRCTRLAFWGFTDRYSWIPGTNPGFGAAHVFDQGYQPKPAYSAVGDLLGGPLRP